MTEFHRISFQLNSALSKNGKSCGLNNEYFKIKIITLKFLFYINIRGGTYQTVRGNTCRWYKSVSYGIVYTLHAADHDFQ